MNQLVRDYTGEGAYHGSTKPRPQTVLNPFGVPETDPTTFGKYAGLSPRVFDTFTATLSDVYAETDHLPIPSQEALEAEKDTTFVWRPFDRAIEEAGPVTREVLQAMRPRLRRKKRYCYVDSKIQWFEPGDVAVDSHHLHLDGTIVIRGEFAEKLGYDLLHDMRARLLGGGRPPEYLSYQSSAHCATQFVTEPFQMEVPDFIPDFQEFHQRVLAANPVIKSQPAASIVRSNGKSVHTAVHATAPGWRLWLRAMETDRYIPITASEVTDCYRAVYRN